ncbi:NAD-binding protein [Schizopora paradoxa]|uniref:NAD-binding protein n=1 Tax=Schizopora paradoxa TaxID=27342 RepID=A0A0H2RYE7_9AGAM|nr:NAD-binding protein [Schizopora paradoxa]
MSKQKIFVTGATGYIGGAVLWRLLNHKDAGKYTFKALVRSPEKAKPFDKFGVEAVVGDLAEHEKLEKLCEEADYIINTADIDDLPATKAMLRGVKKKFDTTGKKVFFIHTSGTSVLEDRALGMYTGEKIYTESVEDIESLPLTKVHRPVDAVVIEAGAAGYATTYILCPCTIYGIVSNPLVDAGIMNPHSIQIPQVIRLSIERGQGGMIGLGKNIIHDVSIDDFADLYIVLFDKIHSDPEGTLNGREGYYFGVNGEHYMYDVYKKIAEVLVKRGIGKSSEPTPFAEEDLDRYLGFRYIGSNCRCKPGRAFAIGWKPKDTTADFLASIEPEIDALIKLDAKKSGI